MNRITLSRPPSTAIQNGLGVVGLIGVGLAVLGVASIYEPFLGGGMGAPIGFAALCFAAAAIGAAAATRRGTVEVGLTEVVIRPAGGRTVRIPRGDIARVTVDNGESAGQARFATGDPARPFLWPPALRLPRSRPLTPNVALELHRPVALTVHPAIHADASPPLPFLRVSTSTVMFAVDDPEAARAALGAPTAEPTVLPAELRSPTGPIPQGFGELAVVTAGVAVFSAGAGEAWIIPVWVVALVPVLAHLVGRHRRRAAEALAAAGNDPARVAAVQASWGPAFTPRD